MADRGGVTAISRFGDSISISSLPIRKNPGTVTAPLFESLSLDDPQLLIALRLLCSAIVPFLVLCCTCCSPSYFSACHTMGKTPTASSRAGRKSKSKQPERKWCTCQQRCNGGKEVAASTYRSHNPTATKAPALRDGFRDGPAGGGGGKREAGRDGDGLGSEGGLRETRRTRARCVAQNERVVSQLSATIAEDRTGTLGLDDFRPQEAEIVG